MTAKWIQFGAAALLLVSGLVFMILAVFGVNKFHRALNRHYGAYYNAGLFHGFFKADFSDYIFLDCISGVGPYD